MTDLIDLHDMGMVQLSNRLGLDTETSDFLRTGMRSCQDNFDRHEAAKTVLPRLVNHGHTATAQDFEDLVTR